jgi:hypothetical protein
MVAIAQSPTRFDSFPTDLSRETFAHKIRAKVSTRYGLVRSLALLPAGIPTAKMALRRLLATFPRSEVNSRMLLQALRHHVSVGVRFEGGRIHRSRLSPKASLLVGDGHFAFLPRENGHRLPLLFPQICRHFPVLLCALGNPIPDAEGSRITLPSRIAVDKSLLLLG